MERGQMDQGPRTKAQGPESARRLLLLFARAAKNGRQAVVALMARVLEQSLAGHLERNHQRPRPRPYARVVEGNVVLERVVRHAAELLGRSQRASGTHA